MRHHYKVRVFGRNPAADIFEEIEQDRHHLDKAFINRCMELCDMNSSGEYPYVFMVIWRDGEPVMFGSVYTWMDGSTVHARRWVARWDRRANEYERRYNLSE